MSMYKSIFKDPNKKNEDEAGTQMEIDDNAQFEIDTDTHAVDTDQFDLDAITSTYIGYARILRLAYVASHCHRLSREALYLAIIYVQKDTVNIHMYNRLMKRYLQLPDRNEMECRPDMCIDKHWLQMVFNQTTLDLEKLEHNLKMSKVTEIKENIRKCYIEIGDFHLKIGDLHSALKSYGRSRDYCTEEEHTVTMCLDISKVSIYMRNWDSISCYVRKAENSQTQSSNIPLSIMGSFVKLNLMSGIAELCMENYKEVAIILLSTVFDSCDFPDLLSHSTIATYGTLCALASFSREELQKNISHNSSFKMFLDQEPLIKDVFFNFLNSKYAASLAILESLKDYLLLDIYIGRHVTTLYDQIRDRAFTQYFDPFSSACMRTMSNNFAMDIVILEKHLIRLINRGSIKARIDTVDKMVYVNYEDKRMKVYLTCLNAMEHCKITSKLTLVRAAMNNAKIEVKCSRSRAI